VPQIEHTLSIVITSSNFVTSPPVLTVAALLKYQFQIPSVVGVHYFKIDSLSTITEVV